MKIGANEVGMYRCGASEELHVGIGFIVETIHVTAKPFGNKFDAALYGFDTYLTTGRGEKLMAVPSGWNEDKARQVSLRVI